MSAPGIDSFTMTGTGTTNAAKCLIKLKNMSTTTTIKSAVLKIPCGPKGESVSFDLNNQAEVFPTLTTQSNNLFNSAIEPLTSSEATSASSTGYATEGTIFANGTQYINNIAGVNLENGKTYPCILKICFSGGVNVSAANSFVPSTNPNAPKLNSSVALSPKSFQVSVDHLLTSAGGSVHTGGSTITHIDFTLTNNSGGKIASAVKPWPTGTLTAASTTFVLVDTDFPDKDGKTILVDDAIYTLEANFVNENGHSIDSNALTVTTTNLTGPTTAFEVTTVVVNNVTVANVKFTSPADASFSKMIGLVVLDQASSPMAPMYYLWNGVDYTYSTSTLTKNSTGSSSVKLKNNTSGYSFNISGLISNIPYSFKIALINEYGVCEESIAFSVTQKASPSEVRELSSARLMESTNTNMAVEFRDSLIAQLKDASVLPLFRDIEFGSGATATSTLSAMIGPAVLDFINGPSIALPLVCADISMRQPQNNYPIALGADGIFRFTSKTVQDDASAYQYALSLYKLNATTVTDKSRTDSEIFGLIGNVVATTTFATWSSYSPSQKFGASNSSEVLLKAVAGYHLVKTLNKTGTAKFNSAKIQNDLPDADNTVTLAKHGFTGTNVPYTVYQAPAVDINDEPTTNTKFYIWQVGGSIVTISVSASITFTDSLTLLKSSVTGPSTDVTLNYMVTPSLVGMLDATPSNSDISIEFNKNRVGFSAIAGVTGVNNLGEKLNITVTPSIGASQSVQAPLQFNAYGYPIPFKVNVSSLGLQVTNGVTYTVGLDFAEVIEDLLSPSNSYTSGFKNLIPIDVSKTDIKPFSKPIGTLPETGTDDGKITLKMSAVSYDNLSGTTFTNQSVYLFSNDTKPLSSWTGDTSAILAASKASAVTTYLTTNNTNNAVAGFILDVETDPATAKITKSLTALTNGKSYYIVVQVSGSSQLSIPVISGLLVPTGAPGKVLTTTMKISNKNGDITVKWVDPANDGTGNTDGTNIKNYVVDLYMAVEGGAKIFSKAVDGNVLSVTFGKTEASLVIGTPYTATVKAITFTDKSSTSDFTPALFDVAAIPMVLNTATYLGASLATSGVNMGKYVAEIRLTYNTNGASFVGLFMGFSDGDIEGYYVLGPNDNGAAFASGKAASPWDIYVPLPTGMTAMTTGLLVYLDNQGTVAYKSITI